MGRPGILIAEIRSVLVRIAVRVWRLCAENRRALCLDP